MKRSISATSNIRTRWAAVGAAVAVTLGTGGLWVADAAGDSDPSVFRSIIPCRLADFRPGDFNVGDKASPLGPGETHTLDATGANGNCDVPSSATAVVANVTALNATSPTNLRLYPADADVPTTSNLNPVPGQPPTPNAVTVGLDSDGEFKITNAFGSVNVIVDLVGYYELPDFDDRYAGLERTIAISMTDARTNADKAPSFVDGCRQEGVSPFVLTIPLDVPVGATITGFTARVRSEAGASSEFLLRAIRETPTATGATEETLAGILGSAAVGLPATAATVYEIPVPSPTPVVDGESYRLALGQGDADHSLCSLTMTYTLPEVED